VNTLEGKDGKRTPFGLSASAYRGEVTDEFEELLIEATACLNTERHESVSLRLYFMLPFDIFEFSAMVVCCTWDCGGFFASVFVAGIRRTNVCKNYVLEWL
jgi:hypothetical protein